MNLDPELISIIGVAASVIIGWIAFLEKRMQALKAEIREKLNDRDQINKIVQDSLKEDIARLESKLDTLVILLINIGKHSNGQSQTSKTND